MPTPRLASASLPETAAIEPDRRCGASSTHNDRVVAGLGSFGGVFDIPADLGMERPLLVSLDR